MRLINGNALILKNFKTILLQVSKNSIKKEGKKAKCEIEWSLLQTYFHTQPRFAQHSISPDTIISDGIQGM